MSGILLSTKLRAPAARPEAVVRPHLMEQLDQGLTRKLTLVSAPPGFGKTTLLSQWIAVRALPVAWLSLDRADSDPVRFLTYLVAALRSVHGAIGLDLLATLHSPQPLPIEPVLTALVNQLADSSDAVVLVLDDYHLIETQPVHDAVAFLLEYLPPQLHLIISSRADPPLPLARLRGRGQMVELRASDLRFTAAETAQFLRHFAGQELSAGAVTALAARTEGWIAGLQMAAVSLRGREDVDGFVRNFAGSHRYILDYLMEEVFRQQPPSLQSFLLRTAILDRLSGPLCDAVIGERGDGRRSDAEARGWGDAETGRWGNGETRGRGDAAGTHHSSLIPQNPERTTENAQPGPVPTQSSGPSPQSSPGQALLERLERANLFVVPLDEGRRWYRYHRLFADLLQEQLRREWPELVPELHRRASGWFDQQGFPTEAIDHALSAEDFERSSRLIAQHAEATLGRGEGATLLRWVGALPDDLVRSRPRLSIVYAVALFMSGRMHEAERRLGEAEAALEIGAGQPTGGNAEASDPPGQGAGERGMMAAIRALMAVLRFDTHSAIHLSSQALECLPETDSIWRGIATMALGDTWSLKGDWTAARTVYEEALATARRAGNAWLVLASSTRLASLQRGLGRLRESADYCRQQLQMAEGENGLPVARAAWMYALSGILCEQDELDGALDYARKSCELSERAGYLFLTAGAYRSLVKVLLARGETAAAEDAMSRLERHLGAAELPGWFSGFAIELKTRLLLARRELPAAARLLAGQGVDAEGEITIVNAAVYRCLARLLLAQQKPREVMELLDRLLQVVESAGLVREMIETLALQALALHQQGHLSRALASLERALSLAEPEGFARTLVNEGPPMCRLLQEAAARDIYPEYARRLLAAFPASDQPSAISHQPPSVGAHGGAPLQAQSSVPSLQSSLGEPLSQRELEVLQLIAEGLSNEEAARRLVLSLPTIKWHTGNIYGKLGVGSRTQAVAKARALGLLPTS